MNYPLISIIITAYNYAHMLRTSLDSALAQDYPNLEIVILDNASTDGTQSLVQPYLNDRRVRYIRHATNIGATANHNAGISLSRGQYLIFLSADDMMLPGRVSRQYRDLEDHPETDLTFSAFFVMGENGQIVRRLLPNGEPLFPYHGTRDDFAAFLAFGNYICFPTLLIPRRLFEQYGAFHPDITATDYEMILRWTEQGVKLGYLPEALHVNRIHDSQASSAPRYMATGDDIADLLALHERYVRPENYERIRGFEHAVSRALDNKYKRCVEHGFVDDGATASRLNAAKQKVGEIYEHNRALPFAPRLAVMVLADGPIFTLTSTLRSLIQQDDEDWHAYVIQPPDVSLAPLCAMLDPRGRITVLAANVAAKYETILNHALILASENCFAFLHSGSVFAPGHVRALKNSFMRSDRSVLFSPAHMQYVAPDTSATLVAGTFHLPQSAEELNLAPCQPLESLAFRREIADHLGYISEDLPAFADWETALRYSRSYPVEVVPSAVTLHRLDAIPGRYPEPAALLEAARRIYRAFPTRDATDTVWRQLYLRGLTELAEAPKTQLKIAEQLGREMRAITGTDVLTQRQRARVSGAAAPRAQEFHYSNQESMRAR